MTARPYLVQGVPPPYCKGCGHNQVLHALGRSLENLHIRPGDLAIVTDIGCVGLADSQIATPHTVHTTHGRSTAFATGLGLADAVLGNARLKPIVMIGDGGAMIGINHLIHAALLNVDITVLVHNNFLFGMTGGQNSAFTPLEFVTATTKGGNVVPPLDLARLLIGSRASFVARAFATDADLPQVLAQAIAHPGFAVVEILELCTAYGTRWNALTGAQLRSIAQEAGYEIGILCAEPRATFRASFLRPVTTRESAQGREPLASFRAELQQPLRLILAGTAGEHVQSAASALARAAMLCHLHATQKNDNPVTQGTGFSVSEVILSREEILYTGIDTPDALLVVSQDGAHELRRNGVLERATEATVVLADNSVALPDCPGPMYQFPLRETVGPKNAAALAILHWLEITGALPPESFFAVLERTQPSAAQSLRPVAAK